MAATREDVNRWIEHAIKEKYKYIISVCDTFDYGDYPVYCVDENELKEEYSKYNRINMQKINEIIRINSDSTVNENLFIENI